MCLTIASCLISIHARQDNDILPWHCAGCMCVCVRVESLGPKWYIQSALAEAGKKRGMQEGCRDGVEVQVREEDWHFNILRGLLARALDGRSPRSYMGLRDGHMRGGEDVEVEEWEEVRRMPSGCRVKEARSKK